MKHWLPIVALCLALPATAEIYKCRLPNGKTEISNIPCPTGSGTLAVRPDEPVSEATRRQAERDVERMRDYVEKRETAQRTEEAAERQERSASQQAANASRTPRHYASADECRRDVDQMVLEANQRAQMEAECRNIVTPQTIYVPVPVAVPVRPHHYAVQPSPPRPQKPAAPSAPKTTLVPK